MTKYELSQVIAEKTGKKTVEIIPIVEAFMKVAKDSICSGENIYLRGFGTFHIHKRAAKPARVISRGEAIVVPAHNIVKFKPAKTFKKKLMKAQPVKEK